MWRLIPFEKYDPFLKTALNQILISAVSKNKEPTIWLSGWNQTCVNIGFGQKLDVVNTTYAKENNIPIVRRQGGGGATLLTPNGEISWAIIAPKEYFPEQTNDIYKYICGIIIKVLKNLNIEATHKPINDVMTNKGKISGSTCKKVENTIYAAGTLLFEIDNSILQKLLLPEKDHIKESKPESDKKVCSISDFNDVTYESVIETLKNEFLDDKNAIERPFSKQELKEATELQKQFKSQEWIHNGKLPN